MAKSFSTRTLLETSHHLMYEYKMLAETFMALASGNLSGSVKDATLESFVIHFRVLVDFFYGYRREADEAMYVRYPDPKALEAALPSKVAPPTQALRLRSTDIGAVDFFRGDAQTGWPELVPDMPDYVWIDRVRANKQIAHMSLSRLEQFAMELAVRDHRDKRWYFGLLFDHMDSVYKTFRDRVESKKVNYRSRFFHWTPHIATEFISHQMAETSGSIDFAESTSLESSENDVHE
jgi:hypothetical protein